MFVEGRAVMRMSSCSVLLWEIAAVMSLAFAQVPDAVQMEQWKSESKPKGINC